VRRAAARFAVVAAAGELATRLGITGWMEGESTAAVQKCFYAWLKARGTPGPLEEEMVLKQIRAFIQAHGTSRFQQLIKAKNGKNLVPEGAQLIRDRAIGWGSNAGRIAVPRKGRVSRFIWSATTCCGCCITWQLVPRLTCRRLRLGTEGDPAPSRAAAKLSLSRS
jgi:hypothetical protein